MLASAWTKVHSIEPINFEDILSEEYAKQLQTKEYEKLGGQLVTETVINNLENVNNPIEAAASTNEDSDNNTDNEEDHRDELETLEGAMELYKTIRPMCKIYWDCDRRQIRKTTEWGIDIKPRKILYHLWNNKHFKDITGIIEKGKDSIVLYGVSHSHMPKDTAIKVYTNTSCSLQRFIDLFGKPSNKRFLIDMWAEKEMENLMRLQECGLRCPEVITLNQNVLVLSLIGKPGKPAPSLFNVKLSDAQWAKAYAQVVDMMDKMFNTAKLVHGDLSGYNILWHQNKCWFIDVSQSIDSEHPQALKCLLADCDEITTVIILYMY